MTSFSGFFLIDVGCNFEARTNCDYTALQLACATGNTGVMDGLLHKGASLEFEQWLDSPLALAIRNGHLGIAQALLKRGVDVREVDLTTHRTFTHLLAWHACRNRGMEDTKASELLEILVRYGASLDAIDIQGNTALHLAATGSSNGTTVPCQLAIIQDLVQKGARVDLVNRKGDYPLVLASRCNDLRVFRLLLSSSLKNLSDKHLARIEREMRHRKEFTNCLKLKEMSALLGAARISNIFDL